MPRLLTQPRKPQILTCAIGFEHHVLEARLSMDMQLGRSESPNAAAHPFPVRSPFLGQDHNRNLLGVARTSVAPTAS
jgi:hypothetical protein